MADLIPWRSPKKLALFALLLATGAGIFYLPYRMVVHNTIEALNAQQTILARQAAKGINDYFAHFGRVLSHLASSPDVIHLNDNGQHLLEEVYHFNQGELLAVTRIDATGHILATIPANPAVIGLDISGQQHNQRIIKYHQPLVSEVFTAAQGFRTVAFAYPVFDGDAYAGSISLLIPFETLAKKHLEDLRISKEGNVWLLSQSGVELFCPIPGHVGKTVFETSPHFPTLLAMAKRMMRGEEGTAVYLHDHILARNTEQTVRKLAAFTPIRLPGTLWSVAVATPEDLALAAVHTFGLWWLVIFSVVIVGVSLLLKASIVSREERKRLETEEKLRERERLFARFIDNAHLPIAVVDSNGAITFLNKQFQQAYGYSLADIPTMELWFRQAYPNETTQREIKTAWQEQLENTKRTGQAATFQERSIVCKDGTVKDVLFAYTLIDNTIVITLNDNTEHNRLLRMEQELTDRRARTSKMEAIGLMAGGVAHDLNNILSGLVGYPELLLLRLPENSELRKPIQGIHSAGVRAAAVVADLLTIARGVASKKEVASLNTLVAEYLDSPEGMPSLGHHHPEVRIETHLDPGLANISCSPVHIKKCIMNLVTNAAEAITGPGLVRVETGNLHLGAEQTASLQIPPGEYTCLRVTDTGSGIPQENLDHIFEPFYTKKVMGRSGTGLGLSVVWNTVQDHDGGIAVQSDQGGTTFTLYFPATAAPALLAEKRLPLEALRGNGQRVLVVDDEPLQRDVACRMLEQLGYQVEAVASGEEAVTYLQQHPMDLLLLDMLMGTGMNGRETYEQVIAIHPGQKAVIASGFSQSDEVLRAARLGAAGFIKKPYTLEELGLAVRQELARKAET